MNVETRKVLVAENKLKNERGESLGVKYYRLEKPLITKENEVVYGVRIKKTTEKEPDEAIDIALTDSFEHVNFIIHYLASHEVTPVVATEVVDYIYDLYFRNNRFS